MGRATTFRRATTWALVALHGLVASGLPLPIAAPAPGSDAARTVTGKDRSRPFPCMDTPCGCDTAEQCFTRCCCRTPAETLAWARARGIEPGVIAALRARIAAPPAVATGGCCAVAAAEPSCCAFEATVPAAAGPAAGDAATAADDPATTAVTLRAMLACNGLIGELLGPAAAGSLPPPRVICSMPFMPGRRVPCADEPALRRPTEPDVPPPRGS